MLGLAQRVASVVSCRPARWRAPTARFLKVAVARGPERVRTVELFAVVGVAEPVQGLDRPLAADRGGDGLGLARVASRLVTPSAAMPDGGGPSSSGMIIGISFVLAPASA